MRLLVAEKHQVELDRFELSQSYLSFWDKFEKCNYILETLLSTVKTEEPTGRLWSYILDAPVVDAGQYDMFINIIEKYGMVPKEVYKDSYGRSYCSCMSRRPSILWLLSFLLLCSSYHGAELLSLSSQLLPISFYLTLFPFPPSPPSLSLAFPPDACASRTTNWLIGNKLREAAAFIKTYYT